MSVSNVLFGIADAPQVVNLLILLAKHYLYMCRIGKRIPKVDLYLRYVKGVYDTEVKAAKECERNAKETDRKWKGFARELA